MEARHQYDLTILPSVCDMEMKLSIADTFALFMDIATVHADLLGVGAEDMMGRGLFWLTVKTKVHFLRRPRMMERVTLSTRPLAPEKIRSIREYRLTKGEELLAQGKTEWTVIETATGKIHPMADVFARELELGKTPEYTAPFCRVAPDFSAAECLGTYRVRSTDIDLGGHMNNVAYLRALLGMLSSRELKAFPQSEVEIAFRSPCFEGETLQIFRRPVEIPHREVGVDLAALKSDGTPAVLLRAREQL